MSSPALLSSPVATLDGSNLDGDGTDALVNAPTALGQIVTGLIIFGPIVGVVVGAVLLFNHGLSLLDLILLVSFYALAGHGMTAGFHRLLTHRSFKATRALKIALAVCGSMGFEGSVNGWVANHRRHHAFTDRVGDPHSPYTVASGSWRTLRGFFHAHVGWLFQGQRTDEQRWVPDLLGDHDLVVISRLFPLWCALSLALPTGIAYLFTHTVAGALGGFIWGGLVRMFLLHHSTFAVNSACHLWGRQPFQTANGDQARNLAPLFLVSMGENWHNLHHSSPTLARLGVDRGQIDSTARLIRILELVGLAYDVRWPDPERLDKRRRAAATPA